LFTVFSWLSAGQPKAREPRGPWLRLTPPSGTKLPSTCARGNGRQRGQSPNGGAAARAWLAPPGPLLNVASVLNSVSSSTLPHSVQHLAW
jgi:hypothetical protein